MSQPEGAISYITHSTKSNLNNASQVTLSSELKTLLLRPLLNAAQSTLKQVTPHASAKVESRLKNELVEQPHVDEVEELRKQLDGQSSVDTTTTQLSHCGRQHVQYIIYNTHTHTIQSGLLITL